MKKFLLILVVLFLGIYLFGCKEKRAMVDDSQGTVSMEALSIVNTPVTPSASPEAMPGEPAAMIPAAPMEQEQLESLPPSGPYKPTALEIQAALKNAGFYNGELDGKIGPMTKSAIEAFQKANGLEADGKVGPRTWTALSKHLNAAVEPAKKR